MSAIRTMPRNGLVGSRDRIADQQEIDPVPSDCP
jgi:hypothetical protein